MKSRLGLQAKIVLMLSVIFFITIGINITLSTIDTARSMTVSAENEAKSLAEGYASQVASEFNQGMDAARTLAQIFADYESIPAIARRQVFRQALLSVLEQSSNFLAVWTVWEPRVLDGNDSSFRNSGFGNDIGRFAPTYYRSGGKISLMHTVESDIATGNWYILPKKSLLEVLIPPSYYSYTYQKEDEVFETSVCVPILSKNGRFLGVAGVDFGLDKYQKMVESLHPYGGVTAIFANDGTVAAHFDKNRRGKQARETEKDMVGDKTERFFDNQKAGKTDFFTFYAKPLKGNVFIVANPITVGSSTEPWAFAVAVPLANVLAPLNSQILFTIIRSLLILSAVALFLWLYTRRALTHPITLIKEGMDALAKGDITLKTFLQKHSIQDIQAIDARGDELSSISGSMHGLIDYISEKESVAKSLADGDFTVTPRVASEHDAFGKAYQGMVESLSGLLSEIRSMIEQIESGSAQVSTASQSLSQGASEQASSLEEVTSSITEITSQTRHNADNAQQAQTLAKGARDSADKGNKQVQDLARAMKTVNESAANIKKIVKTIDDIAFQTNLLALNANVEAARAGKYGKGFAVVAEEVRGLAVKSAVSVKETTEMVEGVVRDIASGVSLTESSAAQFAEILAGATRVADLSAEVAAASGEMAKGLSQVDTGLSQISQVTQANTASAEETASASEELSGQAVNLKQLIARFKLRENAATQPAAKTDVLPARTVKPEPSKLALHPGKPSQARASDKAVVIPKDVIKLDDDDFGKF